MKMNEMPTKQLVEARCAVHQQIHGRLRAHFDKLRADHGGTFPVRQARARVVAGQLVVRDDNYFHLRPSDLMVRQLRERGWTDADIESAVQDLSESGVASVGADGLDIEVALRFDLWELLDVSE